MLGRIVKISRFAAGDIAWKFANIVLLAVAARVLPPEQAALVVLSQTASMIFISLGDLGYRAAGIRLVARSPDTSTAVWRAVNVRRLLAMGFLGIPGALLCAWVLADDISALTGLALIVIAYTPHFMSADWVLLALGKTGQVAVARSVYAAILLLLCAIAWFVDVSLIYFAATILLGYTTFAVLTQVMSRRTIRSSIATPTRRGEIAGLKLSSSLVLALSFGLNTVFHSMEILLAGAFLGESASAIFAAPFRLIFSVYAIGWMLTQYFSPHFARLAKDDTLAVVRFMTAFGGYGAVIAIVLTVSADWLVQLVYGDAFKGAATILQWLAPTLVLDALVACLGTIIVMQNSAKASAFSIGGGCLASIVVFILLAEQGLIAAVGAKYAAYIGLLLLQSYWLLRGRIRNTEGR